MAKLAKGKKVEKDATKPRYAQQDRTFQCRFLTAGMQLETALHVQFDQLCSEFVLF